MKYELDIFRYINIYRKEWKKMLFISLLAVAITAIVTLNKPVTYRSTLTVLSLETGTGASGIGRFLGLPDLSIGSSSNEVVFSMLKSRRMTNDIEKHFNLKTRPGFWWTLDTYIVQGGFAVEVVGSDPEMTKNIANFAVENLDKINLELNVTSNKPIVKVLDPALKGTAVRRNIVKKALVSGTFVFMIYGLFLFFREYFSQLKLNR